MLACVDVGYREDRALAACALFAHWQAAEPLRILRTTCGSVVEYKPGRFYERELPPLLAVLALAPRIETVVIDGYAWLGDGSKPGLGAHLHDALARRTAVVGVAKTRFREDTCSIAVVRGRSARPLFITAAGVPPEEAAKAVARMHGASRLPTLLALADRACRL